MKSDFAINYKRNLPKDEDYHVSVDGENFIMRNTKGIRVKQNTIAPFLNIIRGPNPPI